MLLLPFQSGFNLVEVMIATTIFSSMMVMCLATFAIMSRIYFKGLNESRTQDVAIKIIESVKVSIATSDGSVSHSYASENIGADEDDKWGRYCIGDIKYSYKLDQVLVRKKVADLGVGQTDRALIFSQKLGGNCKSSNAPFEDPQAIELLRDRMRITEFKIESAGGGLYSADVTVAYGGNGGTSDCAVFVCDGDKAIDADGDKTTTDDKGVYKCKRNEAFCAVSKLSTNIYQRVR